MRKFLTLSKILVMLYMIVSNFFKHFPLNNETIKSEILNVSILIIYCLVLDVALIRACVDLAFDGLSPQRRLTPSSRSDLPKKNEGMRSMVTYILAGIVGKQECGRRALCQMGNIFSEVKGKALAFM